MYSANLMMVRPLSEVPEHIRPFVQFDARRRGLELKDSDKVAVLHVATTQSYVIVPVGKGITIERFISELSEIDTRLDADSQATLERLLK